MFGYVNANVKQLSQQGRIDYQRYYCGLCQELHDLAGMKGQLLLNYDLCFLGIMLQSLYEPKQDLNNFKCIVHPSGTKHAYRSEAMEYAAAMDVLLSYHSLMDKYKDDNSKLSGLAASSIKGSYEKVKKQYGTQAAAVEKYIYDLAEAEFSQEKNLDLVSNCTGEMLATLFDWKNDSWGECLRSVGFNLGKFIYIMDAYEDLPRDKKTGNYNPLKYMQKDCSSDFETFIRVNLTSLMAECAKSFERLPIVENAEILRNIIYSGVWTKYEMLHGKKSDMKAPEKQ
ncbi:MAG: DUF5685 family protein [Pseudobutyrivibrio sp.]|nr:DUF5685 family protein [Pseudobutyrivibrio sp.]